MNCYDCQLEDRTTPAVAVCTCCGAGMCLDSLRVEWRDHADPATPGNSSQHRTRTLVCLSCDTATRALSAA